EGRASSSTSSKFSQGPLHRFNRRNPCACAQFRDSVRNEPPEARHGRRNGRLSCRSLSRLGGFSFGCGLRPGRLLLRPHDPRKNAGRLSETRRSARCSPSHCHERALDFKHLHLWPKLFDAVPDRIQPRHAALKGGSTCVKQFVTHYTSLQRRVRRLTDRRFSASALRGDIILSCMAPHGFGRNSRPRSPPSWPRCFWSPSRSSWD